MGSTPGRAEGGLASAVWGAFAFLGLAGLAAGIHSFLVPVYLTRANAATPPPAVRTPDAPEGSSSAGSAPDAEPARAAPEQRSSENASAPETPAPSDARPQPAADIPDGRISLEDAYALWEQGVQFIDARDAETFARGHVAGAIHLSTAMLSRGGEGIAIAQSLPPTLPYVVYCIGGQCEDAENVRIRLESVYGFTELTVMHAGFDDWKAAGYPVEEGAQ